MGKIVYILGAGASADAIPVVNKMAESIQEDIKYLKEHHESDQLAYDILNELYDACINHSSIDTYAKKLFLTDDNAFFLLKHKLAFYFSLRQIIKRPDKRYDNFWASIIEKSDRLPENIRILSWNYDFQLEQSFINMSSRASLKSAKSALDINFLGENLKPEGFSVIKLNGSATFTKKSTGDCLYYCEGFPGHSFQYQYHQLLEVYKEITINTFYKSDLKFSWETNIDISHLENFLFDCDVLVVIGYSYPFFNRKIDRLIINLLSKTGQIKHLYIQDKNPDAVLERMKEVTTLKAGRVTLKSDLNQFVFPIEL